MRLMKEALRNMSLSGCPFFMKGLMLVPEDVLATRCTTIKFKSLRNVHLGISKLLKAWTSTHHGSDDVCSQTGNPFCKRRPLSRILTSQLQAMNLVFALKGLYLSLHGVRIENWYRGRSLTLNGYFLNGRVRGIQELKEYPAADLVVTIVFSFTDSVTGYTKIP